MHIWEQAFSIPALGAGQGKLLLQRSLGPGKLIPGFQSFGTRWGAQPQLRKESVASLLGCRNMGIAAWARMWGDGPERCWAHQPGVWLMVLLMPCWLPGLSTCPKEFIPQQSLRSPASVLGLRWTSNPWDEVTQQMGN